MLFAFFANTASSFSQIRFSKHGEEDGLKIENRWRRSNFFNKNSDAVLIIKLTNTNTYAVNAKLSVGFYRDGILAFSSEEQTVCLEPGQVKRGFQTNFRFTAEGITIAETHEDNFSWDFATVEIIRVEKCK